MKLISRVFIGFLVLGFLRCVSPSEIGADFFNSGSININYTDTLSLTISTVTFDSLISSNSTRLLIGNRKDDYLGDIRSSAIFHLEPKNSPSLDVTDEFAYLTLHLKLDGYSYYDTLDGVHFDVYQLNEVLELSGGYLYSTSTFQASNIKIGSANFLPEPNFIDSVEVPLSGSLGLTLFELAKNDDLSVTSSDEFIEYFKGLALVPDTSRQACFIGIDKTSSMRLYYYDNSTVPVKKRYLEFSVGTIYFNQIKADRTHTNLNELVSSENVVESTKSDNQSFIQSGVGLAVKVNIPFLHEVGYVNKDFTVTKAELTLRPVSYFDEVKNTSPLASLEVYTVNTVNEIQDKLDVTANLINSDLLERDVYYSLDVTSYVRDILSTSSQIETPLILMANEDTLNSTIDRICIGDQFTNYKAVLKIYYLDIKL